MMTISGHLFINDAPWVMCTFSLLVGAFIYVATERRWFWPLWVCGCVSAGGAFQISQFMSSMLLSMNNIFGAIWFIFMIFGAVSALACFRVQKQILSHTSQDDIY